jgi:hypothetical protein
MIGCSDNWCVCEPEFVQVVQVYSLEFQKYVSTMSRAFANLWMFLLRLSFLVTLVFGLLRQSNECMS